VDVADIVRKKWANIGYSGADKFTVINHIQVQSPELAASSTPTARATKDLRVTA
jgi:S-adenosylmethionine synthetase